MSKYRRKEVVCHLTDEELDRLFSEANDPKVVRRLVLIKNLYKGDTLKESVDRVGKAEGTATRWARRWNEGGLGEDEQEQLLEILRDGQPWKPQEIQHLLNEEFDVEYHPDYLSTFLRDLGLSYSIPRTRRPSRLGDPEDILDQAVAEDQDDEPHNTQEDDEDGGWTVDDDIRTDGGTVVGFFEASYPQPWDNSCRMWYVDDPYIDRPLVRIDEPAVGFYALNGHRVVSFPEDQTKERIFEGMRKQNPG